MLKASPCKDCTKHQGCRHTGCKEWDEWLIYKNKENDKIRKNKKSINILTNSSKYRVTRVRKRTKI